VCWLNVERNAAYAICEQPEACERQKKAIDYVLRDANTGHELAVEVSSIWRSKDAGMEDAYIDKWFEKVRAHGAGRVSGLFYRRGRRDSGRAAVPQPAFYATFEDYLDEASEHGKTAKPETTIDMQLVRARWSRKRRRLLSPPGPDTAHIDEPLTSGLLSPLPTRPARSTGGPA